MFKASKRSTQAAPSGKRPAFDVRPYRPEDEPQMLDLLALCLPRWAQAPDPAALWRWKHFASPFGRSHVLVAVSPQGIIGGAVALMPWLLDCAGEVLPCARTVDMVTHPAYRRRGIASSFWPASRDHLVSSKIALTFHTPNRRSVSFSRKGGRSVWTLRPTIHFRRPLRLLPSLLGYYVGAVGRSSGPPGAEPRTVGQLLDRRPAIEELLQRHAHRVEQLTTHRSVDYLAWRYASQPSLEYYAVCAERPGRIDGCVIYRQDRWKGISRLVVQEVLLGSDEDDVLVELKRKLDAQADPTVVHHLDPSGSSRPLLGKLRLPTPKGINFTIGIYRPDLAATAIEPSNWTLSLGDLQEI